MHTRIRKIGNSSGAIIPSTLLKKLNLKNGDGIIISESEGRLIISPDDSRPRYSLDELLAQCDPGAPMPEQLREWDQASATGQESI